MALLKLNKLTRINVTSMRYLHSSSRTLNKNVNLPHETSLDTENFEAFEDPGHPRVALTSDKQTIVMYHPPETIPYENTMAIPRDNKDYNMDENLDVTVMKKLRELDIADNVMKRVETENPFPIVNKELMPTVLKLKEIFSTTKKVLDKGANLKPSKRE